MANRLTFVNDLANHIGQTVTIFTTSGGQSGRGFTGVLAAVYPTFVRLVTQIGSAPGCALGNCCNPHAGMVGPISGGCYGPNAGYGPSEAGISYGNGYAAGAGYGAAGEVVADRTNEIAIDGSVGGIGTAGAGYGPGFATGFAESAPLGGPGRASCSPITLGSVVDIPIDRIAAFVHNAIGSNY